MLSLESSDLTFQLSLQSSVCILVSSLKGSDVLVVLILQFTKRSLQIGNVGLCSRQSRLKAADGRLERGYLALQSSYRTLEVSDATIGLLNILRVVRTASVRKCYASDGEH